MTDPAARHDLLVESDGERTHGRCTCGAWDRDAGADTLALTGRSREDALRSAHDLHARQIAGA